MQLSVVILNYNVQYFLELCIKSIEAAISNINAEIIVVDNNSSDRSCDMVKKNFPHVVLIENKDNLGFSKANNLAVKQAKGKHICILNPDTVVAEDTFEYLLKFAKGKQNLGIIGCKLIDGAGQFLPESKRNIPTVYSSFYKILGNSNYYYANHFDKNNTGKVDVLVGAFMLMKKDVFDEVNGFDEDYFMYGEDIDLSYKIQKQGYDNYYVGNTSIIHFKGESTLKDKQYAKRFYGAMSLFYKKHYKKNIIFDTLIYLGIKLSYMMRREPIAYSKPVNTYYFISKSELKLLDRLLKKKVVVTTNYDEVKENSELIFNTNDITYKEVIYTMEQLSNKKLTFKILPSKSNYIIGSNQSGVRGERILLEV